MASVFGRALATALAASLAATSVSTSSATEPRAEHASGHASKKGGAAAADDLSVLATLADTHSVDRIPLDDEHPDEARFDALLADRTTGSREHLDPRLIELLRTLARQNPGARIELVSGFRSPKLNEMLRKKGHHVASHSQHSLGRAVDFRIVPAETSEPLSPLVLESAIRKAGWEGGTGVYLGKTDRFVHADVGPKRRWNGL